MTPRLEMVAVSDRGMLRSGNEDRVAVEPAVGLAVLADGMGGHNAGEVASGMAVELIVGNAVATIDPAAPLDPADARSLVLQHVEHANGVIYAAGEASRERSGMGTTVVVALWHDAFVTVGHVGDSRLYRFRDGTLSQLTRDHTVVQEGVDSGVITPAQARHAAARNVLTRALGTDSTVEVDLQTFETADDDLYLLCSDGLSEMLDDFEIARVIASNHALRAAADELVRRANDNGGVDNVSVALVRSARRDTDDSGAAASGGGRSG